MKFHRLLFLIPFSTLLILGLVACSSDDSGDENDAETPTAAPTSAPTATEEPATEIPATATPQTPDEISQPEADTESEASMTPAPSTVQNNGNADVTFVRAEQRSDGTWTFSVTVAHPDTGWEDYADGWDVVLPDGIPIIPNAGDAFTRVLLHPHETEQPFTRSQSRIEIPDDVTSVTVRAHDLVDGWGGQEITVDLAADSGEGFEVTRS